MAFQQIDFSTKLKERTINDLSRATSIRAVNRLRDIRSMILFPKLSNTIKDFTDASLFNINGGTGSKAARILWIMDCYGKCCPLSWHANKTKRVVRSTIAAEALSLKEGIECVCFITGRLLRTF